jgi:DNA polymerase-3 subunit beta
MHVAAGEGGQKLRCVATDGHRLARIDADLPSGAAGMPGVIVPPPDVPPVERDNSTSLAAELVPMPLMSAMYTRSGLVLLAVMVSVSLLVDSAVDVRVTV